MIYIICIIISYLLGSIPFGVIVAKLSKNVDLRKVGSGNIGATNVMRVGGLRLAGLVWILDMLKGIAAVLVGGFLVGGVFSIWCGFAAIVGHCFPIWLKFHGGKGVSVLFGMLFVGNPLWFLVLGAEWLVAALISGYSSLGALFVFMTLPVFGFLVGKSVGFALLAISLLCLVRHRENIVRLIQGKESKIEWKWKK